MTRFLGNTRIMGCVVVAGRCWASKEEEGSKQLKERVLPALHRRWMVRAQREEGGGPAAGAGTPPPVGLL